ncbi:MAG: hypothetical protein ABI417_16185 [Coleofasciculaceae cyanobacterium]
MTGYEEGNHDCSSQIKAELGGKRSLLIQPTNITILFAPTGLLWGVDC